MSCYLIVTAKITDLEGLTKYTKAVGPSLAGINFKVLVATNDAHPLEGDAGTRAVIMEFPDRAEAEKWYNSPAYQEVIGIRLASTDGVAVFADGL